MKKILVVFLICFTFLFGDAIVMSRKNNVHIVESSEIVKGIYISYLEYLTYF